MFQADNVHQLTCRELEVLEWVKEGRNYAEIAEILSISPKTVEFHMTNIIRKLGVNNKMSAVVAALKQTLIAL